MPTPRVVMATGVASASDESNNNADEAEPSSELDVVNISLSSIKYDVRPDASHMAIWTLEVFVLGHVPWLLFLHDWQFARTIKFDNNFITIKITCKHVKTKGLLAAPQAAPAEVGVEKPDTLLFVTQGPPKMSQVRRCSNWAADELVQHLALGQADLLSCCWMAANPHSSWKPVQRYLKANGWLVPRPDPVWQLHPSEGSIDLLLHVVTTLACKLL